MAASGKLGGTPLLSRWTTAFDCGYETNWWYVIKDTPFDINVLKAKRRYVINKGIKNFDIKEIDPISYDEELYNVQIAAYSAYPKKYRPSVDKQAFLSSVKTWHRYVCIGAFSRKTYELCGYELLSKESENYIDFTVLKTKPEQEKNGVNAAIVEGVLRYFNSFLTCGGYICDGARSINHETSFPDYLEKYFEFRKAYCNLHITYNPKIEFVVKLLFPMRRILYKLDEIRAIHQINGVLKMEGICREQKRQSKEADLMSELVSIIMPSYNTGSFVKETIESVLAQSYSTWELIIVDDCSTDNTDDVVRPYLADERIHYIKNDTNSGAAVSRNYALREAKGKWIAFLDSDDLWEPEKLQKQISFMRENGYHFSYTNYIEIDEESKPNGKSVSGPKRITKHGMYNYCWMGCLTVMYDVETVGLIQIADIKKNNDYAMWLKVCKKADCYLLDETLAKYRKRSGSISNNGYGKLIKWHYKLYREAEGKNSIVALINTARNLLFGFYKKKRYAKRGK